MNQRMNYKLRLFMLELSDLHLSKDKNVQTEDGVGYQEPEGVMHT